MSSRGMTVHPYFLLAVRVTLLQPTQPPLQWGGGGGGALVLSVAATKREGDYGQFPGSPSGPSSF